MPKLLSPEEDVIYIKQRRRNNSPSYNLDCQTPVMYRPESWFEKMILRHCSYTSFLIEFYFFFHFLHDIYHTRSHRGMYSYNYVSTGELHAASLTELFTQKKWLFYKGWFLALFTELLFLRDSESDNCSLAPRINILRKCCILLMPSLELKAPVIFSFCMKCQSVLCK